jgi:DNA-binding IclR family transcriptional regulator
MQSSVKSPELKSGMSSFGDCEPLEETGKMRPLTGTLGKAISVLDIVASSPRPPRFTDILQKSDQPRGTLHRQLQNLVEEGLLNQRPDTSYELGYRLLKFASQAWAGNEFRKIAEPHLKRLRGETGETVHLGVLRDGQVIYLDKVEGTQSVRMYSQIGNASPAYCTGVGKAAMSVLDDARFEEVARAINFHKYTDHTIMGVDALKAAITEIRKTGNAFDLEEHETGIRCVAAPIYSRDRSFVAGISVTGPAYRVTLEQLRGWAALVRETADSIMEDMGTRLGPRA